MGMCIVFDFLCYCELTIKLNIVKQVWFRPLLFTKNKSKKKKKNLEKAAVVLKKHTYVSFGNCFQFWLISTVETSVKYQPPYPGYGSVSLRKGVWYLKGSKEFMT